MKNASVSAGLVSSFLKFAVSRGASRMALDKATGLMPEALEDPDSRVPMETYKALVDEAVKLTGDGALSLRFSTETAIDDISIVGLIVHATSSMAESLEQLNRYSRLVVEVDVMAEGDRFVVLPDESGELWIEDRRPDPNSFPALTESAFACFIGEMRRHFPDFPFARELEVTHPRPSYADACEEILQVPVRYESTRNALRISPDWLGIEYEKSNSYVFGIFTGRGDALMQALEQDRSVKGQLEAHLLPRLQLGELEMEEVASDLGMTRQTLYRRLKAEGVSFAAVLDDLRCRMAKDYLGTRKVSVNQTAYLVGFSEASSFVRAFRRWTGVSPAAWREAGGQPAV